MIAEQVRFNTLDAFNKYKKLRKNSAEETFNFLNQEVLKNMYKNWNNDANWSFKFKNHLHELRTLNYQ